MFTIAFELLLQFPFAGSIVWLLQRFCRIGPKAASRFRFGYALLNHLSRAIRWSILIAVA